TEGTITKWFKSVGDEISEDEPLFEVSTDKVDSEVPSPESGYLAEILVEEGDTVDVGTKLAVISSEAPSGDGQKSEKSDEKAEAKAQTKTEEREEPKADGDGKASGKVLSPVVRKLIAEHDLDPDQIEGTGQGGRITRADVLSVIDTGKSKAAPKEEKKEKKE